ncbi:hypothetical protein SLE2022_082800 [Rubroshorea leprosula]
MVFSLPELDSKFSLHLKSNYEATPPIVVFRCSWISENLRASYCGYLSLKFNDGLRICTGLSDYYYLLGFEIKMTWFIVSGIKLLRSIVPEEGVLAFETISFLENSNDFHGQINVAN